MTGEGFAFACWYVMVYGPHAVYGKGWVARFSPIGPMNDWREGYR